MDNYMDKCVKTNKVGNIQKQIIKNFRFKKEYI